MNLFMRQLQLAVLERAKVKIVSFEFFVESQSEINRVVSGLQTLNAASMDMLDAARTVTLRRYRFSVSRHFRSPTRRSLNPNNVRRRRVSLARARRAADTQVADDPGAQASKVALAQAAKANAAAVAGDAIISCLFDCLTAFS
jgi:hypothetical protein